MVRKVLSELLSHNMVSPILPAFSIMELVSSIQTETSGPKLTDGLASTVTPAVATLGPGVQVCRTVILT